jgi:hypothetical protein
MAKIWIESRRKTAVPKSGTNRLSVGTGTDSIVEMDTNDGDSE